MTENLVKFSLFYLENEDIQQKMDWKNSKFNVTMNFLALNFLVYKIKNLWGFQTVFVILYRVYMHTLKTPIVTFYPKE